MALGDSLKGKWALILGASSGFGRAAALKLAEAGVNILGVHLDRKSTQHLADETVSGIEEFGAKAMFFNVNASDPDKRKDVLEAFASAHPNASMHVLMHSLAFGTLKPFVQSPKERIGTSHMNMTLDVMAHSLVYWVQDLMDAKLLAEGGRIFAMTSSGGDRVFPTYGAVSAAKAALESHIRQLALELARHGVTANAIRAGVTDTPALRKIPGNEHMIDVAQRKNPFGRLTTPEDVGNAILALSLPQTAFLTGNVLGVDGGEHIVE